MAESKIEEVIRLDSLKDKEREENKSLIHRSGYDVPLNAEPAGEQVDEGEEDVEPITT